MAYLSSLAEYSQNIDIAESLVTNKQVLSEILNSIANNKEISSFSGKKELKSAHKGTFYMGKSHYQYNVYASVFEAYNLNTEKGWSMIVFYDLDRQVLLESIIINQDGDKIEAKNRNNIKGKSFKGSKKKIEKQDCENCVSINETVSSKKSMLNNISSAFIDENVSAAKIGECQIGCPPDSSCKWISAATCILYGFLPVIGIPASIVCTVVTTLVCP